MEGRVTGERIRRGLAFGGFALALGVFVLPLALNVVYSGPLEPTFRALLWALIAGLTVLGFYLGFNGWGR